MNISATLNRRPDNSKLGSAIRSASLNVVVAMLAGFTIPAQAADGCKVLICLAAPDWRAVPECVPTIQQLLRDLSRGRPFPTCSMSGTANSASHQWSNAPTYCPPQYTHIVDSESGPTYRCDYSGAITVNIKGALWTRTWWRFAGGTVTEFTPTAKAQLGIWDARYDDEYAAWLAARPAPLCTNC